MNRAQRRALLREVKKLPDPKTLLPDPPDVSGWRRDQNDCRNWVLGRTLGREQLGEDLMAFATWRGDWSAWGPGGEMRWGRAQDADSGRVAAQDAYDELWAGEA